MQPTALIYDDSSIHPTAMADLRHPVVGKRPRKKSKQDHSADTNQESGRDLVEDPADDADERLSSDSNGDDCCEQQACAASLGGKG